MSQSILNSTKKTLGLAADYTPFDEDVIMHINSVFLTLQQLGVGPVEGFMIYGADETWEDFLGADPRMNAAKTLMFLKVKLLFDPPGTSFAIQSFNEQILALEWRLNVAVEDRPDPLVVVLDGGTP